MATLKQRKLKSGKLVYDIQICIDGKFKCKTWRVPENVSKREAQREAEKIAAEFEESERARTNDFNENMTFSAFADKWLEECYENNSRTYYSKAKLIIKEINSLIGTVPVKKLTPIHMQKILTYLNSKTIRDVKAKLIKPLDKVLENKKIRSISTQCGFSFTTFLFARQGKNIEWGNAVAIAKVLKIDVNEYFQKIENTKKYAKGTKSKFKRVLNVILNKAVQLELLANNPVQKVFIKGSLTGEEKEKEILSYEETCAFDTALHQMTDLRKKTAIALLFYVGMRLGEVGGLEWKDIDFENRTIFIQRSSIYVSKEFGLITKDTKTKSSKRKLKISKTLLKILSDYKKEYDYNKNLLGDIWEDTDRVITQYNGKPITPATIGLWLKTLLTENGLRVVTPHSLRHTHITLQLRSGIPIQVVARDAGHAKSDVTLAVYSHYLKEDESMSADFFDSFHKENYKAV